MPVAMLPQNVFLLLQHWINTFEFSGIFVAYGRLLTAEFIG
jgi:hypothetical protein